MTPRCRVVILTFNCRSIIGQTLAQAQKIDPRPFVVDSHSTDRTAEAVRAAGAELVERAFKNYADQRNWAIAQIRAEWQLHLDADEVLDDEAVAAIQAVLQAGPGAPWPAYMLRRVDYFMGRQLRHSGVNPWHLRLFRSGQGACEIRLYDQHFVSPGRAGRLNGCMHDRNSVSLADWTARHNRWSDLEVAELLRGSTSETAGVLHGRAFGDPRERTRWLKRVYYRLPGGLRATAYFVYRYVLRLGFLDGREGLYFAFLQALWFRMLVDAKLFEARQQGTGRP
jgi:glycosyltransferase involved in cell wall biosynthesis